MQRPGGCASAASVGRRHLWHGWMLGTMQRNQILASSPEHTRACWTDANTCTKSEAMTNHDFYHFGRLLPAPATPSEAMAEDPKSETGKRGGLDAYLSAGCRIETPTCPRAVARAPAARYAGLILKELDRRLGAGCRHRCFATRHGPVADWLLLRAAICCGAWVIIMHAHRHAARHKQFRHRDSNPGRSGEGRVS